MEQTVSGRSLHKQALTERMLEDLHRLMWTMVWDVANFERWQLNPEEVYAELCLELVKLVDRYSTKPYDELKKLCVKSLRNRVHDLATACYLTNRKAEGRIVSLDDDSDEEDGHTGHEEVLAEPHNGQTGGNDNIFDLESFCDGLSDDAKALVIEILYPSERTGCYIKLTAERKKRLNPKGYWTMTITPLIMARGLGWSSDRLRDAWQEVSKLVSNGNQ